jgi:SagB-type dehydrogenase family enzyme
MDETVVRRELMKSGFIKGPIPSDQNKGLPQPPFEKPHDEKLAVVDLPEVDPGIIKKTGLFDCMADRRSRRKFTGAPLSLAELSFLLWATQGVREVIPGRTFRTVPSAGSRHPYETYLVIRNVDGLMPGLYRYLALSHKLEAINARTNLTDEVVRLSGNVKWMSQAAAFFIWAANAYRCEWRYHREAARVMLIDAGHICQNMYLAAEAIGCGTCGIGAYNQEGMDSLLGLGGIDEYVVYFVPVGKRGRS